MGNRKISIILGLILFGSGVTIARAADYLCEGNLPSQAEPFGNVIVPDNKRCVITSDSTVGGNFTVGKNATLTTSASASSKTLKLVGDLTAISCRAVDLIKVDVDGDVRIVGCDQVSIGFRISEASIEFVEGKATFLKNRTVRLKGVQFENNVSITNNEDVTLLTNHFETKISCSANRKIQAVGNSYDGKKLGQCANLQ